MSWKEKLKTHYLKFGPRRFVVFTVLTLILTDLVNCWYLKLYWVKRNVSMLMVETTIKRMGQVLEDFDANTLAEMIGFVNNSFYFFLFIILVNNLFFYLFYLRRKLWAQGFVLFYTVTSALLQVTFIFDGTALGIPWLIYNLLTIPYYAYLFWGVKLLKGETTDPVLRRGKTAQ